MIIKKLLRFVFVSCFICTFLISSEGNAINGKKRHRKKSIKSRREIEWLFHGNIIIKQGEKTDFIPLLRNKSQKSKEIRAEILGDGVRFSPSSKNIQQISTGETFYLPIIEGAVNGSSEETILVSIDGKQYQSILVLTHKLKTWDQLNSYIESSEEVRKGVVQRAESYVVFDQKKMGHFDFGDEGESEDLEDLANDKGPVSKYSDSGSSSITYDLDQGGQTVYPKDICYRPYDPFTRFRNGIVHWEAGNPIREGFSIKDENNSSGYTSALRCPKGPGQYEYSVDGVYKISFDFIAYKVPDHCTATRGITTLGRKYLNCCCNSALTALGGGTCGYINGKNLPDWPDSPKSTCR